MLLYQNINFGILLISNKMIILFYFHETVFNLIFPLCNFSQSYAQIDTLPSFKVKASIYNTFKDIRDSNPLPIKNFKVVQRNNGTYKFELDSISKPKFDLFQKTMVGVSDGNNFFISGRFTYAGYLGIL